MKRTKEEIIPRKPAFYLLLAACAQNCQTPWWSQIALVTNGDKTCTFASCVAPLDWRLLLMYKLQAASPSQGKECSSSLSGNHAPPGQSPLHHSCCLLSMSRGCYSLVTSFRVGSGNTYCMATVWVSHAKLSARMLKCYDTHVYLEYIYIYYTYVYMYTEA